MRLPPPPSGAAPDPTIFEVLGKLGLELKRDDGVLPVYTVERIDRPTLN